MSVSSLPIVTIPSPNQSGFRIKGIDRITPHCVVGQVTAEALGAWFAQPSTKASSNYGIDKDGRVGLYVPEDCRSWCSSSAANDQRAVTIECASDTQPPFEMRPEVYETLVALCVDICRRNGKSRLLWIPDRDTALAYQPEPEEMLLTVHRWFAKKSCPGDWLYDRLGDLAGRVCLELDPQDGPFRDVSPDRPEAPYIAWAKEQGLVSGYSDGTFRPDAPLTRAEAMVLLHRFYEKLKT